VRVGGTCVLRAPAKVNLYLHVGERREDGFHEIDTLFQAVSLWDRVRVERSAGDVTLSVHGPDLGPVEENLAVRAARLFLEEIGSGEGVALELTKDIPAGAGLGGGSSDAAAVLRAMNHLWSAPVSAARLAGLGARLGSDVPFFLGDSALARGTGRGEVLRPLSPLAPADLVLVLPPVHVATGAAYAELARNRTRLRRDVPPSPEVPGGWADVEGLARNDFEEVVSAGHPEIRRSLDALRAAGARPALLSGSGAACFGVFGEEVDASAVAGRLTGVLGWPVRAVRTIAAFPTPELLDAPGP